MTKITLAIPSGKKGMAQKLDEEISSAHNIQDQNHRNSVVTGLWKIRASLRDGHVFLYDSEDDSLDVYQYPLKEFIYHCGKEFKTPDVRFGSVYMLVVLDQNDATIALMSGTGKMSIVWSAHSHIGGKHKTGGQSAPRMERARQLERKAWFRKIATKIKEVYYQQNC